MPTLGPTRLRHRGAALLCLTLVIAGACGSDDDSDPAAADTTTSTAAAATTTTLAAETTTTLAPETTTTAAPTTAPPTTAPPTTATTVRPADVAVGIKSFQYNPNPVTVPLGTTVLWTNMDQIEHTVTSGTVGDGSKLPAVPAKPNGKFNGSMPQAGATFSHRFDQKGTFTYYCARHDTAMSATVVVN